MEHLININKEKCIACGMCVKDCPMANIELVDGKALVMSQACLMCGHCVAVCPKEAVCISGYMEEPVNIKEQPRLNSEELYDAIKFRRSIRQFKDGEVSREVIDRIIQVGRYTPTAKNDQDVSYVVLYEKLDEAEKIAVKYFKTMQKIFGIFNSKVRGIEIGKNFFFKGAPLAILIISKNQINACLAGANMALMAESEGLGVLYSGYFSRAASKSKELRSFLNLGKADVVTTLVLGYPNVKYYRNAQRESALVKYL